MIGAAMAQLPASLVIAGVAVALVGLLPGACVAGAWTVLGVVVFIDLFGEALQLSHWLLDVSPFTHAPRLPGGDRVRRAAALAVPGRRRVHRRRPGRAAPPRHRLTSRHAIPACPAPQTSAAGATAAPDPPWLWASPWSPAWPLCRARKGNLCCHAPSTRLTDVRF